jgi:hypothetical protein
MEFVDNKDIFPKSQQQVTGKVVSYLNDNKLSKTVLKEQVRLNWFIYFILLYGKHHFR